MQAHKLNFSQLGDENGHLVVAECGKQIPFDIKRIFYIYDTKEGVMRGKHANKKSEFVIINISGTSKIRVTDGNHEEIFELLHPHEAVYIPKMLWKDMYDFSENSILLVLSNELYNPDEYIRNYSEYCDIMKENSDENINYCSCLF